jgi:transposase InsO family protein
VLSRRGFVTPQPQKRPRSSFVRFEAAMPNERWQADTTHWALQDGTDVEILNALDDHSRYLVASDARMVFKAADVVASFHEAAAAHGLPASLLTDNGAVFTAAPRGGGRCAIELEADRCGIVLRHSSPYHPQTCGKVERFHQTLKRWLRKQPRAATTQELQSQLDRFRAYYNGVRRTVRSGVARRRRPTRGGQRPFPPDRRSRHTAASEGTGSIQAEASPFVTTVGCTTSRSAVATPGHAC